MTATTLTIASTAMRYQGAPYKWGGWLPTGWDCSGFVGYVLGHDLGLGLPPGHTPWNPDAHPAMSMQYKAWKAGSFKVKSPVAGDLCCWFSHVGIAISPTRMISALDPSQGTLVTPIQGYGPVGEPLSYRRVADVSAASPVAAGSAAGAGCVASLALLPLLPLVHLWRRRDHHRRPQIIGDDEHVVLGEFIDDLPEHLPRAPGGPGDVLEHVLIAGAPHDDDR
jgi:cell wall-associated NlpC family hydrolase